MIEQATIGCLELAAALGAEDPPEAKDTVEKRMWIQSRPGQAPNPSTKTYNQVGVQCSLDIASSDIAAALPIATSTPMELEALALHK